jgi:hypothetical protein
VRLSRTVVKKFDVDIQPNIYYMLSMSREVSFGQRIRDLRKAIGLTQRELSYRVASGLKEEDRRGFDFTYLLKRLV